MARMVQCKKLQRELPGLEHKPFPNELGQRIYDNISQEAWKMWLEHFKMIMNEYRLAGGSEQANQVLFDQAEKYFFGEGAQLPPDYQVAIGNDTVLGLKPVFEVGGNTRRPKFVVLEVTKRLPEGELTFEDVKDRIRESLSQQLAVRHYLDLLRRTTYVDIRL